MPPCSFLLLIVFLITEILHKGICQEAEEDVLYPNIGCADKEINLKFVQRAWSRCSNRTFLDPQKPSPYSVKTTRGFPKFGIHCKKACILNQLGFVEVSSKEIVRKAVGTKLGLAKPTGYFTNRKNVLKGILYQIGAVKYNPDWKDEDDLIDELFEAAENFYHKLNACYPLLESNFQLDKADCKKWFEYYDCVEHYVLRKQKDYLCEMVKNREKNKQHILDFLKAKENAKDKERDL